MSQILKFINDIDKSCKANGYKLDLQNVRYIDIGDGSPSAGFFSEDLKVVAVSLKAKDFIGILAHEYSHLTQYIEDESLYNFYSVSYSKIFEWLDGKRIKNIQFHLDNCLALELDCEKRAVELMKTYELDVDLKDYIKRANAYMYFWKNLRFTRKWCNPYNTPSSNEALVSVMPNRFLKEYVLTDRIKAIFESEKI